MSRRSERSFVRLGAALVSRRRSARLAFTINNGVRLFSTGDDYFAALVIAIDAAERDVALETYIFCDDDAGRPVSEALMRAAGRGVRVRVITDGIGTGRLALFDPWREAGVEHRIYNPHLFGRFGFSRTHRKIAAVDGRVAFCGGINIVDDYDSNGTLLPFPRWDFALELTGPVVAQVGSAFDIQWQRIESGHRPPSLDALHPRAWLPPAWAAARGRRSSAPALGEPAIAFIARDNIVNRRAIEKAYLVAIGRARHEILVANPYFMPGRKMRRALVRAARRGVDVRVIVGRKEFAALDYAVPHLYGRLLAAGVRIGEYEKTMLHAKVAVVDSNWATVGSSNLDALSLVLNHEANVVLVEHPEIASLRSAILAAFEDARPIDGQRYAARPLAERLMNWLAYTTYRAVMKLITVGGYD
ncbi:phospholipase D-like domain-containing protein [Trinickia caryophylli]|uniref:Cardiolipin synthase B n=1 Tax=Trinickia caryophylli TaxID=28094 RepID=A0A1X7ETW2_TRICW|nr:phospholipase D-like domain-containing protein [Trinickia caryophylli]PMS12116.1 cardiolipin synthase B [Trinickia caryophylli]TRX18578.1 cardiolipin synthase B [Trinickia caryophylli]WQE10627.1 phospholipase D-like domain-containing protein [Trinickia caryophylli]SMF39495.1 cardiolipin synthase [Trinickia caryophylli]GLU32994.1 cardiolipin synthase B [Trinickia caryophylli]